MTLKLVEDSEILFDHRDLNESRFMRTEGFNLPFLSLLFELSLSRVCLARVLAQILINSGGSLRRKNAPV
jgi:hypothetical protein